MRLMNNLETKKILIQLFYFLHIFLTFASLIKMSQGKEAENFNQFLLKMSKHLPVP